MRKHRSFVFKKKIVLYLQFYICFFFLRFISLFLAVLGLHCWSGFSLVAASGATLPCSGSLVGPTGFSSCSSWALEHRLRSCGTWALLLLGMWNLPGPGIEPESPALAGGLDTTESPGNHQSWNILDSRKKIAKGWH